MAATAEDFTFPTFAPDPFLSGIDSPPLWRLSPVASPDNSCRKTTTKQEQEDSDDQEEEFKDCFPLNINPTQRKSFSWVEKGSKHAQEEDDGDDKEEKMDMLWEDFNEELSSLKRKDHSITTSRLFDSEHGMVNKGCVHQLQSLKMHSTAMVSPKKPSTAAGFVVFIKVLKKFFLLHNSHHHHAHRSVQTHRPLNRRAKKRSW